MALSQDSSPVTIAVMGATGSGKSTFINLVSSSKLRVSSGMESCTSEVQLSEPFLFEGRVITLIDTPGFDDSGKDEAEILRMITSFLTASYEKGRTLNGVIFLHRISDNRVGGVAKRNIFRFQKLCGDDSLKSLVIATNMWGQVSLEDGAGREKELAGKDIFFKPALDKKAKLVRHNNTVESAHDIIRHIMGFPPKSLAVQRETVDQHKILAETSVGKDMVEELDARIQKQYKTQEDINVEIDEARKNEESRESDQLGELGKLLRDVLKQLSRLNTLINKLNEENNSYRQRNEELLEEVRRKENQLRTERERSWCILQ